MTFWKNKKEKQQGVDSVSLSVEDVAKMAKTSPQTIRLGLQQGVFDFGVAFKRPDSNRYVYIIYPEKVYKLYGRKES